MTKQQAFTLAWKNARFAAATHGGKPSEYFGNCLKLAHQGVDLAAASKFSLYEKARIVIDTIGHLALAAFIVAMFSVMGLLAYMVGSGAASSVAWVVPSMLVAASLVVGWLLTTEGYAEAKRNANYSRDLRIRALYA